MELDILYLVLWALGLLIGYYAGGKFFATGKVW
jgi:hypothetical protein